MSLSPAQLELRRTGITATDVAAILGAHPYRSAIDVWLEKTGRASVWEGSASTRWGERMEPVIRADYEERHGVRVVVPGTVQHERQPRHMATPDGLVYPTVGSPVWPLGEPTHGLEIKWHGSDALRHLGYGEPGTDEVPDHELWQCTWGMHVTMLPRWDLSMSAGAPPVEYVISRDEELIGLAVEAADRFWRDHVEANVPPEPDGSERYAEYLHQRYPRHRDGSVLDGAEVAYDVEELRYWRYWLRVATNGHEHAVQRVQALMGSHEAVALHAGQITWRRSKDGQRTDYPAALADLASLTGIDNQVLAQILGKHTTTVPGTRRFCVPRSWDK